MIKWLKDLFVTDERALNELRSLRPACDWRIQHTEAGTVKVYLNGMLMTHRPTLRKAMGMIRKYIKPISSASS